MSTCLKVIFKQVEGGMEVRTGYDATSNATEAEIKYAETYAKQLTAHFVNILGAEDLTKKEADHAQNS